jgi:AcrR family transcriptional regulator
MPGSSQKTSAVRSPLLPASSRRERRKREVQERIIEAGMALFVEQGCEATTVEQICERADIARKTFYSYYPSRQHLVQALSEMLIYEETRRLFHRPRPSIPISHPSPAYRPGSVAAFSGTQSLEASTGQKALPRSVYSPMNSPNWPRFRSW